MRAMFRTLAEHGYSSREGVAAAVVHLHPRPEVNTPLDNPKLTARTNNSPDLVDLRSVAGKDILHPQGRSWINALKSVDCRSS